MKTHFSLRHGVAVACGAETTWRTRGTPRLDLDRTLATKDVTCRRCRRTLPFARAQGRGE